MVGGSASTGVFMTLENEIFFLSKVFDLQASCILGYQVLLEMSNIHITN